VAACGEREEDLVERRLLADDALPYFRAQALQRVAQRRCVSLRARGNAWRGCGGGAQRTGRR
jgi:hypothetical protein